MKDAYARNRENLLAELDEEIRATARWIGTDKLDQRVRDALLRVPRHEFVPAWERPAAYVNRPLSIGHGQTISQPYIVAAMTQMLAPEPEARVLEVGTGCGYQTAVLAEIVSEVWTIERVAELGESAARRLERLGYRNVHVRTGDGALGWPEEAPFDGIMVTAAAADIPPALVEQLGPGGRMVIPVGAGHSEQLLTLVTKDSNGAITTEPGLPVAFVPLVTGD